MKCLLGISNNKTFLLQDSNFERSKKHILAIFCNALRIICFCASVFFDLKTLLKKSSNRQKSCGVSWQQLSVCGSYALLGLSHMVLHFSEVLPLCIFYFAKSKPDKIVSFPVLHTEIHVCFSSPRN